MVLILLVISILLIPLSLLALGFTPIGIVAGSIAALVQSSIGNVVFGSAFACIQSFAALFWGRAFGLPGLTFALVFIFALWNGYLWH